MYAYRTYFTRTSAHDETYKNCETMVNTKYCTLSVLSSDTRALSVGVRCTFISRLPAASHTHADNAVDAARRTEGLTIPDAVADEEEDDATMFI